MLCQVCEGDTLQSIGRIQDHYSYNSFIQYKCEKCTHVQIEQPVDLDIYYKNELSDSMIKKKNNLHSFFKNFLLDLEINKFLNFLPAKGVVLEVGSGQGSFSERLDQKGIEVVSTDIFPEEKFEGGTEYIQMNFDLDSTQKISKKIEAIVIRHCLEHVRSPQTVIKKFRELDPEFIMIVVPNHKSFFQKIFGQAWFYWDPPRHLHQFNSTSLNQLFKNGGYKAVFESTYGIDECVTSLFRCLRLKKIKNPFIEKILGPSSLLSAISSSFFYLFGNTVLFNIYRKIN